MTTKVSQGGFIVPMIGRHLLSHGVNAIGSHLLNLLTKRIRGTGKKHVTHRVHRASVHHVGVGYKRRVGRPRVYRASVHHTGMGRRRVGRPRVHHAGAWQLSTSSSRRGRGRKVVHRKPRILII